MKNSNDNNHQRWNDVDVFSELGITDADGNQLTMNNVNVLMGYQIVHKDTGRILPHCQPFEIMGGDYAMIRFSAIYNDYKRRGIKFPFDEYIFDPVYLSELSDSQTGFSILYTEKDQETYGTL